MGKITVIILVLLAIGLGYFLISPLFRNVKLDEALPVADNTESTGAEESIQSGSVATGTFEPVVENKPTPEPPIAPVPTEQSTAPAPLVGTSGHPASGTARIVTVGSKNYVRYENFKTINGPDIFVYLSKDLEAKESVNIGKVKATEGNVNYEIPAGINPVDYPYVLIWCRAFGVLFNSAKIY